MSYRLEAFTDGAWRTIPGYEGMGAVDANFVSGYLNRSTNYLVRAVREQDGTLFHGRVPKEQQRKGGDQ